MQEINMKIKAFIERKHQRNKWICSKKGSTKKARQTKDTKSVASKAKELSVKTQHETQEEAEHWRVEKSSIKRAKILARIPREKPPTDGKELILISTPPKKGKEVIMDGTPFLALVEFGQEGDYRMIDIQEEEQMEEDEVEEYVPLSQ